VETIDTLAGYDSDGFSVAPEVALGTGGNRCVELMIPDDLSELIRLWPMLNEEVRSAVLALARAACF
jgi:hypothetical protein